MAKVAAIAAGYGGSHWTDGLLSKRPAGLPAASPAAITRAQGRWHTSVSYLALWRFRASGEDEPATAARWLARSRATQQARPEHPAEVSRTPERARPEASIAPVAAGETSVQALQLEVLRFQAGNLLARRAPIILIRRRGMQTIVQAHKAGHDDDSFRAEVGQARR